MLASGAASCTYSISPAAPSVCSIALCLLALSLLFTRSPCVYSMVYSIALCLLALCLLFTRSPCVYSSVFARSVVPRRVCAVAVYSLPQHALHQSCRACARLGIGYGETSGRGKGSNKEEGAGEQRGGRGWGATRGKGLGSNDTSYPFPPAPSLFMSC
jgi:hypothetical protein